MRLRLLAPLLIVLALTGCTKAPSESPAPSDTSSNQSASATPASTDDTKAIQEVATKFMRAAQIADWTTVCSVSVDKVGAAITGDGIKSCADNYLKRTNSADAWAKLTKEKQAEIIANSKSIEYIGTPKVTGTKALTDQTWNFKGETVNNGPALALVKVDGKWWVDTTNTPSSSTSAAPSTSASPIAS